MDMLCTWRVARRLATWLLVAGFVLGVMVGTDLAADTGSGAPATVTVDGPGTAPR
jgi:hypothetical protein